MIVEDDPGEAPGEIHDREHPGTDETRGRRDEPGDSSGGDEWRNSHEDGRARRDGRDSPQADREERRTTEDHYRVEVGCRRLTR